MMHGEEQTRRALLQLAAEEQVDFEFVAGEAGDRPISPRQRPRHHRVRQRRGRRLYSDLLFVLTHNRYPPERAERLWKGILRHKEELSQILARDVGIAVAALDYLSNLAGEIERPTVINEPKISAVVEVATRDGMTGLYDHLSFQLALSKELRRFRRYGQPVSLIMLDLDHFKRYNDTHGHQAGDRVVSEVGRIISEQTRDLDIGARYGGEEFAVIAPSTESVEAFALAERIRRGVARELCEGQVTLSAGVATCPDDGSAPDELVRAADTALYRAKEGGRDRTCVHYEPSPFLPI
jgi:diguanylate cyclase (GGDEF)-like protein